MSAQSQYAFVRQLGEDGTLVTAEETVTASRDPSDNRVLEAAVAGSSDYIVSGDNDLLILRQFGGIPIVTARQFLDLLMAQSGS